MKKSFSTRAGWLPLLAAGLLAVFTFSACGDDEGMKPSGAFGSGIFIVNEGPFQNGSGTLSFWNRDSAKVTHQIFEAANSGEQLGNVLQSMHIYEDRAYLVVNNAGKVVVAATADFTKIGEIQGLAQPRYFLPVSSKKALVSQWGADGLTGSVAVVNLETFAVEETIATGTGPEQMLKVGNRVYVANVGGGFGGRDSTVAIVDLASETVVGKIMVGDNPGSLALDKNGAIWVAGLGHTEDFANPDNPLNTKGRLVKLVGDAVAASFELAAGGSDLVVNKAGDRLFFLDGFGGSVHAFGIGQAALSAQPLLAGYFYALGYDGEEGRLLVADAKDFQSDGEVKVLGEDGSEVRSIAAGVIPGSFWVE